MEMRFEKDGKTIKELGKSSYFGATYAFDPAPINLTISAIDDTLMFRLRGIELYDLMNEHPDIARALIPALCKRVRTIEPDNI